MVRRIGSSYFSLPSTCSACCWWPWKIFSPVVSRSLSSGLLADGINVFCSASFTVLWYATLLSMYALSKAAPLSLASSALFPEACLLNALLVSLSCGVTSSFFTSARAFSFTAFMIALHVGREFANVLVLALCERLLRSLDVDLAGCVGDVRDLGIVRLSSVLCKCTARGKAYGGNGRD